jgi:hypothetical protein
MEINNTDALQPGDAGGQTTDGRKLIYNTPTRNSASCRNAVTIARTTSMVSANGVAPMNSVRRHINWNNQGADLKEDLAHLVQDIKRHICGIASAGSPSFSP